MQSRSITIREPDGKLRKATWEERDRMNLIYFPKTGRKHEMPELLKDENLKVILDQILKWKPLNCSFVYELIRPTRLILSF